MYQVRIYVCGKLKDVRHYDSYENALSDVVEGDNDLYEGCVDGYEDMDFSRPHILSTSVNNMGFGCDFKFRYPNDVEVMIQEVFPVDEKKEC